jgi:hypothetical protein
LLLGNKQLLSCPQTLELQARLGELTLSNEAITEREVKRREIQQDIVREAVNTGLQVCRAYRQMYVCLHINGEGDPFIAVGGTSASH